MWWIYGRVCKYNTYAYYILHSVNIICTYIYILMYHTRIFVHVKSSILSIRKYREYQGINVKVFTQIIRILSTVGHILIFNESARKD